MYITAPLYIHPIICPVPPELKTIYKPIKCRIGHLVGAGASTRVWHQSNVERNLLNSSKNLARDTSTQPGKEENNLGTG